MRGIILITTKYYFESFSQNQGYTEVIMQVSQILADLKAECETYNIVQYSLLLKVPHGVALFFI